MLSTLKGSDGDFNAAQERILHLQSIIYSSKYECLINYKNEYSLN